MPRKNAKQKNALQTILKDILTEILPDEKKVVAEAKQVVNNIQKELQRQQYKAKVMIGGSVAKGTFLRQDHDIDIFVMFDKKKYANSDLSAMLESTLKKLFPIVTRIHGSRDYFQVKHIRSYELVPILFIKKTKDAQNITDCSPLHVQWVKKFPQLKNEIRLFKAFCKAVGVYGAESYIQGFSGHVVDILTIYYKGFVNVLKASQKWKAPVVLDYYKTHKGKVLQDLNVSKTQGPLILVDPIQPERNAAAAVGMEKFLLFQKKAKQFLQQPSKQFFVREIVTKESLKKKAKSRKVVLIEMIPKQGKVDVVGAQLRKAFEYFRTEMERHSFLVHDAGWQWDKGKNAFCWLITDAKGLSDTYEWQGPPLAAKQHVEAFKAKHGKTFVRKGSIWAIVKRPYTQPEYLLESLLDSILIKEKISQGRIEVLS